MPQPSSSKNKQVLQIKRLGRYRIVRPLSKGGMAQVFEARRESLAGVSPRVAVKLILPEHADSGTFQELFINEARLGASMHHQNLVQIQDFDLDGENFFLVMEYVEGMTLRQVVAECVRSQLDIPVRVIAEIGRQACEGLHYAHQATDDRGKHLGLVHRDVKPSNLMLNPHGVLKILDFGISKGNLLRERAGAVRGTWGYMAPEQAQGKPVGPQADIFGLATILYELAAKKPIFRRKQPEEIKRLLEDDHAARLAATLSGDYAALVGVLVRALQRDPAARHESAAEFGRALSALLPDPITARDEVISFLSTVQDHDRGLEAAPGAFSTRHSGGPHTEAYTSIVAVEEGEEAERVRPWVVVLFMLGLFGLVAAGAVVGPMVVGPTKDGAGIVLSSDAVDGEALKQFGQGADPGGEADPEVVITPPKPQKSAPKSKRNVPSQSVGANEVERDRPVRITPDAPVPEEAPVVVTVDRRTPVVEEPPPEEEVPLAEVAEPVALGVGWVSISAQPYETNYDVFIDGKLVQKSGSNAPVIRFEVEEGEHFVTISATGGRQKQFKVTVEPDQHVKKTWDFDRNSWR